MIAVHGAVRRKRKCAVFDIGMPQNNVRPKNAPSRPISALDLPWKIDQEQPAAI